MRAVWAERDTATERYCPVCDRLRPLADFRPRPDTGHERRCRECLRRLKVEEWASRPAPAVPYEASTILPELPAVTEEEVFLHARADCKGLPWWDLPEETCLDICAGCPVLQECREHGDRVENTYQQRTRASWLVGVVGGETPEQRARRRRGGTWRRRSAHTRSSAAPSARACT